MRLCVSLGRRVAKATTAMNNTANAKLFPLRSRIAVWGSGHGQVKTTPDAHDYSYIASFAKRNYSGIVVDFVDSKICVRFDDGETLSYG